MKQLAFRLEPTHLAVLLIAIRSGDGRHIHEWETINRVQCGHVNVFAIFHDPRRMMAMFIAGDINPMQHIVQSVRNMRRESHNHIKADDAATGYW